MLNSEFINFLIRAKRATYASGITPAHTSRPASHDFHYKETPYLYIDTYLGGFHFIGEEAVWQDGVNIYGMNYYGKMLSTEIPAGFGEFLKSAMLKVTTQNPYRGPAIHAEGEFLYTCFSSGDILSFEGHEEIFHQGKKIYRLVFHGGELRD